MAFNPLPQSWFTGMTDGATACSATDMVIPIGTFPELTAAEIDASTGDIRKFMFAFLEKCWAVYNALATADKPTKMTMQKSASVDTATGVITNTYVFTIKTAAATQEVVAES